MILNVLWGPDESLSSLLCVQHLLDTWLSLWQWVFQPAIGVLMLGALVSGAVGWVKENVGGTPQR